MPHALLAQIDLQTVGEEIEHFVGDLLAVGFHAVVARGGLDEGCAQRKAQLVFENDANDAERGAAQGVRILRTRRLFVDGEETDEAVELIG